MTTVGYSSPFIPPEWILAHGLTPRRIIPTSGGPSAGLQGMCPFAHGLASEMQSPTPPADAFILATTCDQMRRMGDLLGGSAPPHFLLNVPATWQTPTAASVYLSELHRLGGFLERLGGQRPGDDALREIMIAQEKSRQSLLVRRPMLSARQFIEACLGQRVTPLPHERPAGIRLAVIGGPFTVEGLGVLDEIERQGGQVVLDAGELGERTFPARFNRHRLIDDPLGELARAYFGSIADAFRRPDTLLHEYLARETELRRVRGMVLVRQVWCDQWLAQACRLRESMGHLPLLDLDISHPTGSAASLATRVGSFLEILR